MSGEGDVYARALVRMLEYRRSGEAVLEWLKNVPPSGSGHSAGLRAVKNAQGDQQSPRLKPNSVAVSLIEGWRGQLCHCAITNDRGELRHYKIVDPSFHNWPGLAYALRGQQISDFPLCNKSFNLSYCGFDL